MTSPVRARRVIFPLLLLLWLFINTVFSKIPFDSELEFHNWINYFLVFYILVNLIKNSKTIVKYPVFAAFVLVIIGTYQLFLNEPVRSAMVNQNIFAGYLIMTIPLMFYYFSTERVSKYLLCIMSIICLLFTKSVAAICALLIAFFIVKFKWRGVLISVFILMLGICLKINEPDLLNRYLWWTSTLNIIRDNPVLGTGLGSFQYVFLKYKQPGLGSIFAHNYYLQLGTETGIIGLLLFLIITVWCLSNIKNQYFKIAILACLIHNVFDYSLFILANGLIFWAIMAVGIMENRDTSHFFSQEVSVIMGKKWVKSIYVILIMVVLVYSVNVYKNNLAVRCFFQGENAFLENDLVLAEKKFTKSINVQNNFYLAHNKLAYVFVKKYSQEHQLDFLNRAIDNFKKGIKYNPYNGNYYIEISNLYAFLGDKKLSGKYLSKAILYNPSKSKHYLKARIAVE